VEYKSVYITAFALEMQGKEGKFGGARTGILFLSNLARKRDKDAERRGQTASKKESKGGARALQRAIVP